MQQLCWRNYVLLQYSFHAAFIDLLLDWFPPISVSAREIECGINLQQQANQLKLAALEFWLALAQLFILNSFHLLDFINSIWID